ncbi:MAG: glycosyltransferase family 4 protein [Anaerolineae bacterium]
MTAISSAKSRRIALVAPFGLRAKGTTRARVLPLARQLAAMGHRVAVFIPPYDSPEDAGRRWEDAGVEVVNCSLPRVGAGGAWWHLALAWRLLRAVGNWRPELVHVFKPKGPSGLVGAALWTQRPRAARPVLVMDSDDWEGPGGWNDDPRTGYTLLQRRFFAWQERFGLSHADAWTVTSECLRRRAIAFGAAPERIATLHNGIDVTRWSPVAERWHKMSPGGPPTAILYTRFAGVRPADVRAIWSRVRAALPEARLLVIGRGVAGEERNLADLPGVTIAGWVEPEALPERLAAGQVALVPWADTPSNRARHSAKVLDLMAAGMPIVAYAVGELPATLGDAAVLVPPGDEATFARQVVALLTDRPRGQQLAAAAQARAAGLFTWERLAQTAVAVYERVLWRKEA